MERYDWSQLNTLQVGKYAEYFVKMEFTLFGFDVYTSEVDDHGVDFVVRTGEPPEVDTVRGFEIPFYQGVPVDTTRLVIRTRLDPGPPHGSENSFRGICLSSDSDVFVVGDDGEILRGIQ